MNFADIQALDAQYVEHTYGRFSLAVKEGQGASCVDFEGKRYIDFSSGIGVNSLGFADAQWAKAVAQQAGAVAHISNLFYTAPGVETARLLCQKSGMEKVFFCNSGAEANEGAIKAARLWGEKNGKGSDIVTLYNSFHGRTLAALAATGQPPMHEHFGPFPAGFSYAEAGNLDDLKQKLTGQTCAVMLELIQGEGGVIPLEADYVKAVAALCAEQSILLVLDEVQTGIGRTGAFFCYQHYGLSPDIVTAAKGLGGGLPVGAILFGKKTAGTLCAGDHGSTFGMNPVVCAGANVVLERLDDAMLASVTQKGDKLATALRQSGLVESVTGLGLMLGLLPKKGEAKAIVTRCLEKGLIALTAKNKVRLLPPLVVSDAELEQGLAILIDVLKEFNQQ